MKRKRTLSLMLSLILAFSLFAGIAPAVQADDAIGTLLDRYFFKKDYLDSLFNSTNMVKQGTCGKDGAANVWYEIYEVTSADLNKSDFFKTLANYVDEGYTALDPDEKYYGVKIYGNGEMENYKRTGFSAPWCDKVTLDKGPYAKSPIEVDMDKYLVVAYIEGAADHTVNGKTVHYNGVTNVGQFAFFGQDQLSAVYFGDTVARIEDRAFESTEMLAAMNAPTGLEYLGKRAFYGCDKLTYWRAGACSKLTEIGERAFYGCSLLATVQFPANLKTIGPMAFAWCRILGDEEFALPSGLVTIGDGAFMFDTHMGRINEINIPKNVQTIGNYAFLCCFGIGKGENDGLSFSAGGTAPLSIGNYAFAGCRELKNLKLDNRVTQIHTGAFAACERLENVVFGNDFNAKRVAIDANAFTSMQSTAVNTVDYVDGITSEAGEDTSDYLPTVNYDQEELAAFTNLTAMTPLRDAAFQNRPASRIDVASGASHSFPVDCIVHYPAASYNPTANTEWQGALDAGTTTWKGYETKGDWTGHFHVYQDTVIEPTCTTDGYTHHACTICHETFDDSVVEASHDLKELRRFDATCTEEGMIVYECQRADCPLPGDANHAHIYTETIPAKGHDYSKCEVKEPTCTEPGYRRGNCPVCGEKIDETTPAKGHNPAGMTVVRAATCTEEGLSRGRCIDCGKTVSATTAALGHDWGEWKITKSATATTAGEMQRVCKHDASHVETKAIPATGGDTPTPPTDKPAFVDVKPGSWYAGAVDWAVENGITNGTDATHFSPNADCTRAQMVTFLWRAMGSPTPTSSYNPFTDLKQGAYYYNAVLWAVEEGITTGTTKTTFSPNDKVTRGQTVTFLWRMEGELKVNTSNPFVDVDASKYYYDAVLWAVENDITTGMDATHFAPKNNCTRAQIVTFLWRDLEQG